MQMIFDNRKKKEKIVYFQNKNFKPVKKKKM